MKDNTKEEKQVACGALDVCKDVYSELGNPYKRYCLENDAPTAVPAPTAAPQSTAAPAPTTASQSTELPQPTEVVEEQVSPTVLPSQQPQPGEMSSVMESDFSPNEEGSYLDNNETLEYNEISQKACEAVFGKTSSSSRLEEFCRVGEAPCFRFGEICYGITVTELCGYYESGCVPQPFYSQSSNTACTSVNGVPVSCKDLQLLAHYFQLFPGVAGGSSKETAEEICQIIGTNLPAEVWFTVDVGFNHTVTAYKVVFGETSDTVCSLYIKDSYIPGATDRKIMVYSDRWEYTSKKGDVYPGRISNLIYTPHEKEVEIFQSMPLSLDNFDGGMFGRVILSDVNSSCGSAFNPQFFLFSKAFAENDENKFNTSDPFTVLLEVDGKVVSEGYVEGNTIFPAGREQKMFLFPKGKSSTVAIKGNQQGKVLFQAMGAESFFTVKDIPIEQDNQSTLSFSKDGDEVSFENDVAGELGEIDYYIAGEDDSRFVLNNLRTAPGEKLSLTITDDNELTIGSSMKQQYNATLEQVSLQGDVKKHYPIEGLSIAADAQQSLAIATEGEADVIREDKSAAGETTRYEGTQDPDTGKISFSEGIRILEEYIGSGMLMGALGMFTVLFLVIGGVYIILFSKLF